VKNLQENLPKLIILIRQRGNILDPRESPRHVRGSLQIYNVRMAQFLLKIEKLSHIMDARGIPRLTVSIPDYGSWCSLMSTIELGSLLTLYHIHGWPSYLLTTLLTCGCLVCSVMEILPLPNNINDASIYLVSIYVRVCFRWNIVDGHNIGLVIQSYPLMQE